jgi:hypothetical protein
MAMQSGGHGLLCQVTLERTDLFELAAFHSYDGRHGTGPDRAIRHFVRSGAARRTLAGGLIVALAG